MRFLRTGFWVLIALNFIIRGWFIFNIDTEPVSDFVRYYHAAISLSEGNGYVMFDRKTAFQGIGYPGFLAVFFSIFGPSVLLAKILNGLLSFGSMLLFLFLAKRMVSERIAMLATLIFIFLPKEMVYVNVLGSEHLFNALLLGFFSCYIMSWPRNGPERTTSRRASRRKRSKQDTLWLIPTGVILGVMSLVKPLSPLFGLILFLGEICRFIIPALRGSNEVPGGVWKGLWRTAIVAVLAILVISPWTIRNYVVFDSFVPLTTNSGYVLFINNNPDATGMWMDPATVKNTPIGSASYPETDPRYEVEMDQAMQTTAWTWIKENPTRFTQLSLYRIYETFYRSWDWKWAVEGQHDIVPKDTRDVMQRWSEIAHAAVASPYFLGVIPVLAGIATTIRRYGRKEGAKLAQWEPRLLLFLFSLPAVVIIIMTMIFEGNARYSFPCHPAFALYTALLIGMLWKTARKENYSLFGSTKKT